MKTFIILLSVSLLFFSCSKNSSVIPPGDQQKLSGEVKLSFQKSTIPSNIVSVVAMLSREGFSSLQKSMNFITDSCAEVTFDSIAVGTWNLVVKAYDIDSVLKYQGSAVVLILDGQTTIINLAMVSVTSGVGSVQINVTWGSTISGKWVDNLTNPLLKRQNTIYDGRGVGYPIILKDGEQYKMYYTNTGSMPDSLGAICTIGLATSEDGNNWIHYSAKPLLLPTPGEWDSYIVSASSILKEDSIYKMYYTGMGKGMHERYAIGMALSSDGIHWKKRSGAVFEGESGWENYNAGTVAVFKVDGEYWMYYTGYPITHLGLATSSDGVNWTRKGIVMSPTQEWEQTGIGYATILRDGQKFKMVYMNNEYNPKFGYAISSDGKNSIKSDGNPIFTQEDVKNNWAPFCIAYPSLNKIGSEYRIYYSGAITSSYQWAVGYAKLQ